MRKQKVQLNYSEKEQEKQRKPLKKRKKCDIINCQDKQVYEALSIEKSSLGGASRQQGGTSC